MTTNPADLGRTRLYAGEGEFGGKYVHVLAYQNVAKSDGPNAMILPIPAAVPLDERNAIDTRKFRDFLKIITEAIAPRSRSGEDPRSLGSPAKVFDVGTYTVVLANDARSISAALERVPAKKRPPDNEALFAAFEDLYPGWPLAVCCWNGDIDPEPLLWWYEPLHPEWIFAPALDAHDGGPPNLDAEVRVDHAIAFGSPSFTGGYERLDLWLRHDIPAEVRKLLPLSVRGVRLQEQMPNGDFWIETAQLAGPVLRRAPGRASAAIEIPLDGWT